MSQRASYAGLEKKLILAFDIGTTFSGVSYCILEPGLVPEIKSVTKFPSQEQVNGHTKVPTVVYYDSDGQVCAIGAETGGLESTVIPDWEKAEWFKLHMRPQSEAFLNIPALPAGKTAVDVFVDFLKYLLESARTYIEERHVDGADTWQTLRPEAQFILTHPNGWEGPQQVHMRRAAVRAGLVPDTEAGYGRVHFVTEGEASLHYCIRNGLTDAALEAREGVLVVDAGGGTIDISAYTPDVDGKFGRFVESAPPQCHLQGSIFVTRRAHEYLTKFFAGSEFQDDVDYIARLFDESLKIQFRNSEDPKYIKFGSTRTTDAKLGIRSGLLKLSGKDVASFFEPSVECIVEAILEIVTSAETNISAVFLVGGFANSDWLFHEVRKALDPFKVNLYRPDGLLNKAVAEGGVSYYIDRSVVARMARHTYGAKIYTQYDPTDPEHRKRSSLIFVDAAGALSIRGMFSTILSKNTQITENRVFWVSLGSLFRGDMPSEFSHTIFCYKGSSSDPRWTDIDSDNFTTFCTVTTDSSHLVDCVIRKPLRNGSGIYSQIIFAFVLSFGLTELTAHVVYRTKDGNEKRVPARITYAKNLTDLT